jgi:hypothetical protein
MDFEGTLVDFGCGLGDAMPVYREHFPKAKLIGVDISQSAIDICRTRYGTFAAFAQGDCESVPTADVIIASNVLEHLTDDREAARCLLSKCKSLYVVVPYKEAPPLCDEHVNTYDERSFSDLGDYDFKVFPCVGWSPFGIRLWYHIYFKNVFRFLLRMPLRRRNMQIIFRFSGSTTRQPSE